MFEVKVTINIAPELLTLLQFFSKSQGAIIDKLVDIKDGIEPPADLPIIIAKEKAKKRIAAAATIIPISDQNIANMHVSTPVAPLPEGMTDVTGDAELIAEMLAVATKPIPLEQIVKASTPITLEQIRAICKAKAEANKRKDIKALIASFNVKGITDLTVDQYPDFLAKLNTL